MTRLGSPVCPIDGYLFDGRCAYCRSYVGVEHPENLLLEAGEWAHENFPLSTDHSKLTHIRRELAELTADPSDGEEMADIVLLLAHLAYEHRVDLMAECRRKLAKNRARRWGEPDADGVVEHVREESA